MAVQNTSAEKKVALFDSTTGLAFGPVFESEYEADEFLEFAKSQGFDDVRELTEQRFEKLITDWDRSRSEPAKL